MNEETGHFRLDLDGRGVIGLFTEANGGGSENNVIEHTEGGTMFTKKLPGTLKVKNITLTRCVSPDRTLWDWRQQVVDGNVAAARSDGTITVLDSTNAPLATYAFKNGWVSKYTPIWMRPGQDEAPVEEVTITVESFSRV